MSQIVENKQTVADHIMIISLIVVLIGLGLVSFFVLNYVALLSIILGSIFIGISVMLVIFYLQTIKLHLKYKVYETFATNGVLEINKEDKKIIFKSDNTTSMIDLIHDTYDIAYDFIIFYDTNNNKWYKVQHDNLKIAEEINNLRNI